MCLIGAQMLHLHPQVTFFSPLLCTIQYVFRYSETGYCDFGAKTVEIVNCRAKSCKQGSQPLDPNFVTLEIFLSQTSGRPKPTLGPFRWDLYSSWVWFTNHVLTEPFLCPDAPCRLWRYFRILCPPLPVPAPCPSSQNVTRVLYTLYQKSIVCSPPRQPITMP